MRISQLTNPAIGPASKLVPRPLHYLTGALDLVAQLLGLLLLIPNRSTHPHMKAQDACWRRASAVRCIVISSATARRPSQRVVNPG